MQISDELLEKREEELTERVGALGGEIYACSKKLTSWLPARKSRLAALKTELLETLCARDEIREVRRLLLGKAPNAHLRRRDVPNFVGKNPDYAAVVAEDCSCSPIAEKVREKVRSLKPHSEEKS